MRSAAIISSRTLICSSLLLHSPAKSRTISCSAFNLKNLLFSTYIMTGAGDGPKESKKKSKDGARKEVVEDGDEDQERGSKLTLKTPKGMRDIGPAQMVVREKVFKLITDCFKLHGAQALDTPVSELRDTLTGKYGEEAKLIYDLADQGGEILSLRYDLTVPFARYLAQHKIHAMKRYQIAKVYRRDNPKTTKGRFREFYQCDFDIAGPADPMIADSECLRMLYEILHQLDLKSFVIKLNHRQVLSGIFEVSGVPAEKFKTICSSIDKLGKLTWEEIKKEMCEEKGLKEESADKIGELIKYHGMEDVLDDLLEQELGKNSSAKAGLEDLKLLSTYCKVLGIENSIEFDLSLARGLDYYTGVIYEAILKDDMIEVGSIAAGGRYDGLVAVLSDNKHKVPCIGVSIGIERILAIIEERMSSKPKSGVPCYVVSIGKGMVAERLALLRELWDSEIPAEHSYKSSPKFMNQIQYCEDHNIPFILLFGENEIKEGIIKIRDVKTREETEIKRPQLIETLKTKLAEINWQRS